MDRCAAITSDGRKCKPADRETVDQWARDEIKRGAENVWVYGFLPNVAGRKNKGAELIGYWEKP